MDGSEAMRYEVGDKVYITNPNLMDSIGSTERERLQKVYGKLCIIHSICEGNDYSIRLTCGDEIITTQFATNEIKTTCNIWQGDERSKYANTGKI